MRKLLSYLFLSLLFVSQIKAQDNNFDIDSLRRIGLPVIIVNTVNQEFPTCDYVTSPEGSFGQSITNNNKVACQIIIIQEQDTLYNSGEYKKGSSGATIKINGNTSAYWFDNKPYKIKLEKKADLLLRHDDKYEDKEHTPAESISYPSMISYGASGVAEDIKSKGKKWAFDHL